ncbi:hypothetical protein CLAFUR0_06271 [Fulvia fulva]|nr:hypothetical protein CLAFUR0_06271 [Fulvia fulva]
MSELYHEVPLGSRQVRLLRFMQDTPEDILRLEMKTFSLDPAGSYTALSYCWGKDAPSKLIKINGHDVLVRSNLFAWLQLGAYHSETIKSWFFIDAICINKDDLREKAIQVEFMGDIYKNASRVEAWLGPDRELREGELELWRAYCQRVYEILQTYPEEPREHVRLLFQANQRNLSAVRLILSLLLAEYWTRLWIVQEVTFGKKLDIRLGELCIDWTVVLELGHFFFKGYSNYDGKRPQEDPELFKRFIVQTPAAWTLEQQPEMIRAIQILEQRADAIREPDSHLPLGTVLVEYAFQQCTVPHDKIFGLISLSQSKIRVDYDMPLSSLFIRAFTESLMDIWMYSNFPKDNWTAALETVALTSALLKCLLQTHPFNPVVFTVTFSILEKVAERSTASAAVGAATMSAGTWVPFGISSLDYLPEIVGWWMAPVWWAWSMMLMWICRMRVAVWRWGGSKKSMPGENGRAMPHSEWRGEVIRMYDEVLEELHSGCTVLRDIYRRLPYLLSMEHQKAKGPMQGVVLFPTPNEKSELYYHIFSIFRRRLQFLAEENVRHVEYDRKRVQIRDLFNILVIGLSQDVGWSCNMLPFYERVGKLMQEVQDVLESSEQHHRKKR